MMKKSIKILLIVGVVLVLCWMVIFSIDYNRVINLKMPIFVIGVDTADDGGSGTYYGLGYKVEVVKNISAEYGVEIEEIEMYVFEKVIAGAIADYSNINNNEEENNSGYFFYATVIESDTTYILVEVDEGEDIRRSADQISINLGKDNDMIYPVGMRIKVTYTGEIMESYPAQVSATNIEIVTLDFELDVVENVVENADMEYYKKISKDEVENQEYDVYCYNVSVLITIDGEQMTLREAVLNGKITVDDIIAKANQDVAEGRITADSYLDGGSMVYHYDTYTILKCHTLDGNRDVYFGDTDFNMEYVEQ